MTQRTARSRHRHLKLRAIALAGTSSLAAALMPAQASAQVICDSGVGTEVGFEETLEGNSDTLGGIYDLRTTDFGGTVFAGTLVVNGGGVAPLDITTERGLVRLEFGDIEIAEGACVVADRLVIDRAQVTVRAGALLGGNTGLLATSTFPDGGVGGTDVIGSTVNFTPGSEVLFLSPWNLLGTSTLSLDLDNAGNPDSAIFSKLSGGPFSTLEVAAGTTMSVSRFSGDAGTFEGTLAGEGTIVVRFGLGGTATWTVRPSESTFSGNVVVDNYMTLVAEDLGPASLAVGPRGRAFASGVLGSLEVSDFIGATDPSENVSTLGARLGINADGTPGRLDVTGDVTLSPLTVLTMNLGAPNGVPGVDSDLITVGGNLSLDGVLLVDDAGGFGFGLYRLFTYGGALTDGSLEVVGVPTGFSILDFDVSTAISGQVNLLVGNQGGGEEPPEIAMFPADSDTLGANDYDRATTLIFAGAGREIAIDGTVERGPGGIQFADDDFELNPAAGGGSFFLPGTDFEINVGDGTAAGAGFTGTIGADIAGLGGITKTGLGTLVLTGNNSIEGGIRLVEGMLQGTTASLTGAIDFGSIDIEQRILSTTVIITGGAGPQLDVTALGGNYQLVGGIFEVPLDVPFVPDRLVISDSTVTVGSGATFGTGLSPFAPGTIFADGGLAGTELVNSTLIFNQGSQINFLSAVQLQDASTLIFNNGPDAGPVIRSLSGGADSTLEVGTDTTLTISSARNKGTFEGTLNGNDDSTIVLSGAGEFTLRPKFDSTYTGTVRLQEGVTNLEFVPSQLDVVFSLLLDEGAFGRVFATVGSLESEGTLAVCGDRAANGEGPVGACGSRTGPLTVTGDMTLGPTSHLQVILGEATAAPIINVGGNLTIGGLFDFRVGSSHSCGTGLYRIIGYGGTLTDNGADIGERPECFSGTDLSLQTSTPGQVNLLAGSTGGEIPEIAFFPEDTDIWMPGDFDPATTVILQGQGRAITLPGEVPLGTGGIQFADDDFSLVPGGVGGRLLFLDDPFGFGADTPIRVGDGTAAGAATTATIAVDIVGAGGLLKIDLGTLVLTGNNSYTGGTTVEAGTVRGSTESLQGNIVVLSGATVAFTGDTGTVNANLSGSGEATFDYTQRVTLASDLVASGLSAGIRVGDLLIVPGGSPGTVRFERLTIDSPASLTLGQGVAVEVGTLTGATGSLIFVDAGSFLDLADECTYAGEFGGSGTLGVGCDLTLETGSIQNSGLNLDIRNGLRIEAGESGGDAAFGAVTIDDAARLTLGTGATVSAATLDGAAGSLISLENGSVLDLVGDCSHAGATAGSGTLVARCSLTLEAESIQSDDLKLDIRGGGGVAVEAGGPGATAGFDRVLIAGGASLGVGADTSLEVARLEAAEGSRVSVAGGGTLFVTQGSIDVGLDGNGDVVAIGALSLNGDAPDFAGRLVVESDAVVSLHVAENGAFGGTFAGDGNITVDANGNLTLVGDSRNFGGKVSIEAGDFSGHSGNLPGSIEILDAGALRFVQEVDGTHRGTVTGGGGLVKTGEGELTLETTSAWSRVLILDVSDGDVRVVSGEPGVAAGFGGVTIAGGSGLTVGPDTTVEVGSLTGAAGSRISLDPGSVLDLDGDCSHAGAIAGTGTLAIGCDLTLASDLPDFGGNIDVGQGGTLTLNGSAGALQLTEEQQLGVLRVLSDGSLEGFGRWFGRVLAKSGGTVGSGNSIGTLTVGAITFEPGSIFEIEVNDAGQSDLLSVTGAATLNGGIVRVLAENRTDDGSTYAADTQYVILIAGGDVTGTFDEVTEDFAFLSASLAYGADRVTLSLTRDGLADFCIPGASANQCAVGEGVDSLGTGALFGAVLVLSETAAPGAFDALSGEIHASLPTMLLEDSRFPREAAIARLRIAFRAGGAAMAERPVSDRFSFWGQAFGVWGDRDGDGNAAGLDRSIGGFAMGGDALVGDAVRVGLFGGYTQADYDADARASSGSTDSLHLGVYGGGQWGGFGLRAGGAYAWHDMEVGRAVGFTGFSDRLSADYDARTLQAFAEAGYRFGSATAALEPFAGVAHVSVRSDGFGENGGPAALVSARRTRDATFTTLGLRAETALGLGIANIGLSGMAGWRHAFGKVAASVHRFASGGAAFAVSGTPLAEDTLVLEAGFDAQIAPRATIGIGYSGQFGSGPRDHGIKGHLIVTF